jgi:hypothetical protein
MFVGLDTRMIYKIQCQSIRVSLQSCSIHQIKTDLTNRKIKRSMKFSLSCKVFHYGLRTNKKHFPNFLSNFGFVELRKDINENEVIFCFYSTDCKKLIALSLSVKYCIFFKKILKRSNETNLHRLDLINMQK